MESYSKVIQTPSAIWVKRSSSVNNSGDSGGRLEGNPPTQTWDRRIRIKSVSTRTPAAREPLSSSSSYKPPHKLSVGDLLWGLREDMSILEVIERDIIPTDLKERLEHNSDEAVAAVLTQTFHYMI
jgi:hypothetical protein